MDDYKICFQISGIEAFAAGFYLLTIPSDPSNSLLFGLSLPRLVNFGLFLSLGLTFIVLGFWLHRFKRFSSWLLLFSDSLVKWQKSIWISILLMLGLGLIPVHKILDFALIWERLLPTVVLSVGIILNFVILMIFEGKKQGYFCDAGLRPEKTIVRRWLVLLAAAGVLVIVISSTGFGIIPPLDRYWNTAGVPVLPEQVLYIIFGYIFLTGLNNIIFHSRNWKIRPTLMFLGIWVVTFLVWNSQPIAKSFFVYQPAAPNYEYYPSSDALRFDVGGQLMLAGRGILNGSSEEKPFEMAFLALLQALTGKDYQAMVRIQVLLVSLTTPILYLIGKRLYSDTFGAALAVMGILYEVNTFHSSVFINSAHIKLLLSEPLMLLGVVVITYSLMCWMEKIDQKILGVITLGLIGLFSYVRANVLLLYFAAFGLIVLSALPNFKKGIKQFLWANLGFFGVFLPWMIYAYKTYGYLTIINKFNNVLQNRILGALPQLGPIGGKFPQLILKTSRADILFHNNIWEGIYLQAAHFINSIIKSLLIFPTDYKIRLISDVLEQPYWDETIIWDGTVSGVILINLAVILLGIVFLISKNKLLGAVPLIVALLYNLASAFVTTSGGRYLKPSIWIFILYFLAGIFFILDRLFLAVQFGSGIEIGQRRGETHKLNHTWNKRLLNLAAALLIGIGFAVPIADAAIPEKYPDISPEKAVELIPERAIAEMGLDVSSLQQVLMDKDLNIYFGAAQYPRQVVLQNAPDYFGFSLVGPLPSIRARLFGVGGSELVFPPDSLVVALGCQRQAGNLTFDDIVFAYLIEENLIYSLGSDWMKTCPPSDID